jgi:hypothetical protein
MYFARNIPSKETRKIPSKMGLLQQVRNWIEAIEICDSKVAQLLSKIPASCPFARDIRFLGHTFRIPPLCKLNPLYDSLMILRFRALIFLNKVSKENLVES